MHDRFGRLHQQRRGRTLRETESAENNLARDCKTGYSRSRGIQRHVTFSVTCSASVPWWLGENVIDFGEFSIAGTEPFRGIVCLQHGVVDVDSLPTNIHDLTGFIKKYRDTQGLLVIDPGLLKELLLPSVDSKGDVEKKLKNLQDAINILDDNRGIVLSIQEDLIFDPGESKIKKEVRSILEAVSRAINSSANDILIVGHTDNVPIKNERYDSNWELSAGRGLSVLDYFVRERDLPPSRFTVGGYGASRPLFPNNTAKNRALNRRVEIIFKHIGER